MPILRTLTGFGLLGASLAAARVRRPRRPLDLAERLRQLPARGVPVRRTVRIHWNRHHIPFIEAEHDRDAAVALGVVHAHLRLAQMEVMRRAATGRLSEVLGPAALDIDHVLRALDVTRAVPAMEAMLPDHTRTWLEGFLDGVNHMAAHAPLPEEFRVFRVRPRPWTLQDLLAVGRLAATDFTWKVWITLLRHRHRADWLRLWQRMMGDVSAPLPAFAGSGLPDLSDPRWPLEEFGRHGSNSLAVAAARSGGSALIASDPHLSYVLPNLWLLAGYRSPSYHVVGLMVPGIPVVALGRNPWIAWGGTSLHAASSELFDVTDLPASEIRDRIEEVPVRWWGRQRLVVHDTEWGPVISDSPVLRAPPGRRIALHWVGHAASDELSALLRLNRARDWQEFRGALEGFAVPAQNMVYADAEGRVGQAMAARLPSRPHGAPADMVLGREARSHWQTMANSADLPAVFDPPRGFVASANNRPEQPPPVPLSYFFSPDDRVDRLRQLLGTPEQVTLEHLKAVQQDVFQASALRLRDLVLAFIDDRGIEGGARLLHRVRAWDGHYHADSAGALAFELLITHFARELHGDETVSVYMAAWEPWELLLEDFAEETPDRLAQALAMALPKAAQSFGRHADWGSLHRLRLSHFLAPAPLIGHRYKFADDPVSGSNETVMKSAHGFSSDVHAARFGANARHLSDLGDLDANWFCLVGGNDGWLGSATFLDQYDLWRRGDYVQLPMRLETVRAHFPYKTDLTRGD